MPLFMDVHDHVDGLTAEAVAGAHAADLEVQEKYGVDYMATGSTRARGRCSASSTPPTPGPPPRSTARRTASSPTSSYRSRKATEPDSTTAAVIEIAPP